MLKKIIITLCSMLVMMNITLAQNNNYKAQFNIDESGVVLDENGKKIGSIDKEGSIKNSKGETVGKFEKKSATSANYKMGNLNYKVDENGTLKDEKDNELYKISLQDANGYCKITDAKGNVVGYVHQNYKQQGSCVYHCLSKK